MASPEMASLRKRDRYRAIRRQMLTSGHGEHFRIVHFSIQGNHIHLIVEATDREARFHEVGDVLFAAINVARKLKVDPELALRAAADRFRGRVEGAEGLAASEGSDWNDLSPDEQIAYYARARLNEES